MTTPNATHPHASGVDSGSLEQGKAVPVQAEDGEDRRYA